MHGQGPCQFKLMIYFKNAFRNANPVTFAYEFVQKRYKFSLYPGEIQREPPFGTERALIFSKWGFMVSFPRERCLRMTVEKEDVPELRRTKQMRVEELIDRVQKFHQRAAELYGDAAQTATAEEAKLVLDHLERHELEIATRLKAYRDSAPPEVLETWFKYAPDVPTGSLEERIHFDPDAGREEVAEVAATLSDLLLHMYDTIVGTGPTEDVEKAIDDLRKLEQREKIIALQSTEKR